MSKLSVSWGRAAVAVVVASFVVGSTAARAEDTEKPWDRSIAAGLAVATGNTDSILFTGALKGQKLWEVQELRLQTTGAYGKTDGAISSEKIDGLVQYKYLFTERFYGSLILDALHDGAADLSYRAAISPGVGYYFIKNPNTRWGGEVGPGFQVEKYYGEDRHAFVTLRVSERFEHKFNENAKCWQETTYTPQVDDFQNYQLTSEAGIEAALTKAMSLRVVGQHLYNNRPANDRRHYDILLTSSIAYKF